MIIFRKKIWEEKYPIQPDSGYSACPQHINHFSVSQIKPERFYTAALTSSKQIGFLSWSSKHCIQEIDCVRQRKASTKKHGLLILFECLISGCNEKISSCEHFHSYTKTYISNRSYYFIIKAPVKIVYNLQWVLFVICWMCFL